ncbi:MAG TPA: trehalose-6-phosphate synthase [Rhodanobacteraceae bacterium]|jgi:trehalose 6-phosphate synthase|nr:trehalose-6-phosphate synthase [Rhodanobacteraceae bacterium]
MGRLIVVSNRVALPKETRAGGLASALSAALAERGGIWFGWSGRIAETEAARMPHAMRAGKIEYALLDLTRSEYEHYYLGFSNRTLWPLLHFRPSLLEYKRADFEGYLGVNRLFAEHLARLVRDDDLIWIHDYHLIPLADELRKRGVAARIGFFLHIPLPTAALLTMLPHHEHLFPTLAAYDLIGLQNWRDRDALLAYFRDEVGAKIGHGGRVALPSGRSLRAKAFPIAIDTPEVARQAERAFKSAATQRLIRSLEGRALAIGVDRLDYSKGLPQRFEAFAQFLSQHPHWRSRISFLQIAPPSREEVPEYRELRSRLERLAGATNGRYAEPDWMPIRYVNRSFNQTTLAGFYRAADIAVVTPLRDGMNLVAKEYVASQAPEDPGVLILSSFAGASDELKQAIIINPFDADDIGDSLEKALTMPLAERRERWRVMYDYLVRNDIAAWRASFLDALTENALRDAA